MSTLTRWSVTFLWGIIAFGCTNEAINPRTCGEGTVEVDGVCQSLMECGAGTTRVGDQCQFAPSVLCGLGTILQDDVCIRESPERGCGADTVEVEGECVREFPLVTCGSGTVEQEGQCVVADPLACGEGTSVEGTVCTHQPCGEGTVLSDDGITCEAQEFTTPAGISGLCPQGARYLCESIERCECTLPEDASETLQLIYGEPELCEAHLRNQCENLSIWLAVFTATGQVTANPDNIEKLLRMYQADGECNLIVEDILGGPDAEVTFQDLLDPALDSQQRCLPGVAYSLEVCLQEEEVCRVDPEAVEEGALYCLERQGLYLECSRHEECLPSLYCDTDVIADPTCQTRPTLDESCDPWNEPCAEGTCCIANVCSILPAEGSGCCSDYTCGDPQELYCNTWGGANLCATYAEQAEPCGQGVRCDTGLMCHQLSTGDETPYCYASIPFCEIYPM